MIKVVGKKAFRLQSAKLIQGRCESRPTGDCVACQPVQTSVKHQSVVNVTNTLSNKIKERERWIQHYKELRNAVALGMERNKPGSQEICCSWYMVMELLSGWLD